MIYSLRLPTLRVGGDGDARASDLLQFVLLLEDLGAKWTAGRRDARHLGLNLWRRLLLAISTCSR